MKILKALLGKLLFNEILYLGEKTYIIERNGSCKSLKSDSSESKQLVILGKEYYFETSKVFPFLSMKDIRSAVRTDYSAFSPFSDGKFYIRKIKETSESAAVNLWFIDEYISEKIDQISPFFVIPESALLSFLGEHVDPTNRIYCIHKGDKRDLFVFIDQDGGVRSMISYGEDGDALKFKRSIGAAANDCTVTEIRGIDDYFNLFIDMLNNLPFKKMFSFLDLSHISLKHYKRQLKIGFGMAMILSLIYVGISGFLPYWVYNDLLEEDRMFSENLTSLLDKQASIDRYYKKYKEMAQKINNYPYKTILLENLRTIFSQDTIIRHITVYGNVIEIRGETLSASDLLHMLSQSKGIKGVGFSAPLRKDERTGKELFRIAFTYE